jgi:hypothetical protein
MPRNRSVSLGGLPGVCAEFVQKISAPGKSGSLGKEVRITDWKFEYGTQQVKVLSR